MKPKNILRGAVIVGVTAIYLARVSDNELHTSILPYELIEHFPVHGDIYRNTSGAQVDTTNTRSSSDSLDDTVLQAKQDGMRVVQ